MMPDNATVNSVVNLFGAFAVIAMCSAIAVVFAAGAVLALLHACAGIRDEVRNWRKK